MKSLMQPSPRYPQTALARPHLSASDSRIPDYLSVEESARYKSLTTSQNNLQPSDIDFEWVQILAGAQSISFMRPFLLDMFVYWKSGRKSCTITSHGTESIRKATGAEAWGAFFSNFQRSTTGQESFQVVQKSGWKTFSNVEDLEEFASDPVESFLVVAMPDKAKKVRLIPWQRDPHSPEKILAHSRNSSPHSSVFLHDITRFRYAGRLKRSSFSPYLPYSSVLGERLPRNINKSPDASDLLRSVQLFLRRSRYDLYSMILHVTEDVSGQLYLLDITNLVWVEKEHRTLPPVMSTSASTPCIIECLQPKSSAKKSAKMLLSRTLVRPPYIDSSEIQRKNIDMYTKTFSGRLWQETVPEALDSPPMSPVVQSLNSIAEKFDQQRLQLEHTRLVQKKVSKLGLNFRKIVQKAYSSFQSDEVLSRFFGRETGLQHLSEQFYLALITPSNYYLSRKIHSVHKHFGITEEHFQAFINKFREAMLTSGVSEEDASAIIRNICGYRQDVVSSS